LWRPLATAFLLKWPSLHALKKGKAASVKAFYYRHGSRSTKLMEERLALIERAVPVSVERANFHSFALRVQLLCRQLQLVQKSVVEFDEEIAAAFAAHPDRTIFASLPGAGPVLGPRLLASLGSQRERFERPEQLQRYSGIAPVTKQSGGSCHIHRRYLCPQFHRQSFHEYAKESVRWSRWARAYYLQQRSKGSAHHSAVRALAYKWQRVIWRCWTNRTAYDERIYEAALRKNQSPLVALFERIEPGKSPWKNRANKN
jgi:transposase